jgi:hypothetical protein
MGNKNCQNRCRDYRVHVDNYPMYGYIVGIEKLLPVGVNFTCKCRICTTLAPPPLQPLRHCFAGTPAH